VWSLVQKYKACVCLEQVSVEALHAKAKIKQSQFWRGPSACLSAVESRNSSKTGCAACRHRMKRMNV
jgi:hypothetical protein